VARARGISREQRRPLDRLKVERDLPPTYLAGGVAVALHLGHRRSRALDLFTFPGEVSIEPFRRLAEDDDAELVTATDVAIHLRLGTTPVDVVRYRFPLLEQPVAGPGGWSTAGLIDLAAMKLAAIARRGLRRDFWDLDAMLETGISLTQAGEAFRSRFGKGEADLYHVTRAPTSFDDAERDTIFPEGMSARRWSAIKACFEACAHELLPR
jgi:hypothetical protein